MRLLFNEGNLTEDELKARDTMIYLFNPVLKFIFQSANQERFKMFGFNSCRQTAILGAGYLEKLLPDYEFSVYEGNFIELMDKQLTPYIHAFIIASKDNRNLLIDLSRTEKPLIFSEVFQSNIYPTYDEYANVTFINKTLIDYHSLLMAEDPEYLTNILPQKLMNIINKLMCDMSNKPSYKQKTFCDMIYEQTTKLRR